LYGRGVTDCLGHVAMISEMFRQLAILKPKLNINVWGVFIANEENSSEMGIGIDEMEKRGELRPLKHGPVIWVDSADFGPTLGTGGSLAWEITCTGKLFHSGIPHKAINAIEMAMDVIKHIQERFYKDTVVHAKLETDYNFEVGSSFKPTQITCPPGSLNQIPEKCTISGDIRLTPFYNVEEIRAQIQKYVNEIDVSTFPARGYGRYELKEEGRKGTIELKWLGAPYKGVAVDMTSHGYKALKNAIDVVNGKANPYSLTGSLPIIRDLKDAGYDVQVCGFGRMSSYHAHNESGRISDFTKGSQILARVIDSMNSLK